MFGGVTMEVGKKIKRFRTALGLSQKELAQRAGMSEPAIRNYELGNRTPSEKQLEKISDALGISIYAISDPNFESYNGMMHALFLLEDEYGFAVKEIDGQLCLVPENKNTTSRTVSKMLSSWNSEFEKLKSGEITKEEYDMWRYSYPLSEAKRAHEELKKSKNNIEK
jgi:transcriptional regulator with XRE-family HTH domain